MFIVGSISLKGKAWQIKEGEERSEMEKGVYRKLKDGSGDLGS
jgi:hypothetical protein